MVSLMNAADQHGNYERLRCGYISLFDISCHFTPIAEKPFDLDNSPGNIGCNHEPFFVDFFLQSTPK